MASLIVFLYLENKENPKKKDCPVNTEKHEDSRVEANTQQYGKN